MKRIELNRRDFNRLTMAAFGGIVAGTTVGCAQKEEESGEKTSTTEPGSGTTDTEPAAGGETDAAGDEGPIILTGANVCRGLNSCANHKGGDNTCAGQGSCALAATHSCHAENDCKGQGGCEETAGQNSCKGKGNCAVPLGESAWKSARAAFEAAMKEAGKDVGAAPAG